jgi:ABC-type branched-subunit amino acid transport system substrate-binding protein
MKTRSVASILSALVLVATACGARLTDDQRAAGIGTFARNGAQASGALTPGQSVGPSAAAGDLSGGQAGVGPSASASASLPPGGNGGATDVGITGNTITLATVADVSGVQPGLFRSAWQAMNAFNLYINTSGGIYGRQLKTLYLDSRADATSNRAAVTQACDDSFAMVGSMSAFDDGGASAGQKCMIPDISAITVNRARTLSTNVYPASPNRPDLLNTSWGLWAKHKYPEAIKHSAMLYLNAGATQQSANQRLKALGAMGYKFVYKAQVQVLEGNYSPYVEAMKNAGVQLVNMVSDYQSLVRLQKSMKQQGWTPTVRLWDSVAYSQKYIDLAEESAEGSLVFINTSMFEEAASNAEMQLYQTWLQRAAPGAVPDYFGIYAWSAGRLFEKAARAAGPKLTRAGLFAQLKAIHAWSANGLHVTEDIGNKREANCTLMLEVRNGRFVRIAPASGWDCEGQLAKT